tara:strand:- start:271 stop:1236 length:966 start_codon:yes stop_codon:yes gene_type:complete
MMSEMIALQGLTKIYGSLAAVDGIDLSVGRGEVLGFLGPNGAGKSTTMKMVAGYLPPTSGTVTVCGHDVVEEPIAVKSRLGYLPEGAPTYGDMTVGGFLDFIAEVRGFDGAERRQYVERALGTVSLEEVVGQRIDTLSKGFKRRVGLAQAILHDPEVLILDEPTDGLDPNQKHHVRSLIREMAREKAIVISTHILEEVEAVCSRAVIIDAGRLLADGTAEELQARLPYHNAVALTVAAEDESRLRTALGGLDQVASLEVAHTATGAVRFRVLPQSGQAVADGVAGVIRTEGIAVEELMIERGRLDDVFRQITGGEPEAGHA